MPHAHVNAHPFGWLAQRQLAGGGGDDGSPYLDAVERFFRPEFVNRIDHIVPFAHGEHVVTRLPDAELYTLPGESHLAGLGFAEEILQTMVELWDTIEKR